MLDVELTVDLAGVEEEVPRLAGEHSADPGREAEVKPFTGACSVLTWGTLSDLTNIYKLSHGLGSGGCCPRGPL